MSFFSGAMGFRAFRNGFSYEAFRAGVAECRSAIGELLLTTPEDKRREVISNILSYLDKQLSRSADWIEGDVDLIAFVMRSILDLHFWATYVTASDANLERFIKDERNQLGEIYKKTKGVMSDVPPIENEIFEKRLRESRFDEYADVVYLNASKYIHASSFLLADLGRLRDDVTREMFAKLILAWAWRTLEDTQLVTWTIKPGDNSTISVGGAARETN